MGLYSATLNNISPPSSPVPCTFVISQTDFEDGVITELFGATDAVLLEIWGTLSGAANAYIDQKKQIEALSASLPAWEKTVAAIMLAIAQRQALMSAYAANQIQSNNFFKTASPDKPQMPSVRDQLTESATNSLKMFEATKVSGGLSSTLNSGLAQTGAYIAGLGVYKTVAGWLTNAKNAVLSILPDSAPDVVARSKT